ncbi:hypothetical protein JW859_12105 [bacterium]|nr:hypothetical protein [bacterium]
MRLIAVVLLALLLLNGCPGGGRASHELPADWPIAQLTIDPAWELHRKATAMHALDPAKYSDKTWLVAFDKDQDWAGVVAHVESCLKPLGYLRMKEKGLNNPLGLDLPEMRTYYSPDYLTEVMLTNGVYFDALINTDIEFALQIKALSAPPELIQTCLNVNKSRPGTHMGDELLKGILEPIS